jgi:hypothetical protein
MYVSTNGSPLLPHTYKMYAIQAGKKLSLKTLASCTAYCLLHILTHADVYTRKVPSYPQIPLVYDIYQLHVQNCKKSWLERADI